MSGGNLAAGREGMIIDLKDFEPHGDVPFGLCIIGGGAAGLTLAREFIGRNLSVCLLESGGLELGAEQELDSGETTGLEYYPLVSTRLRFLGGATNHWGGKSRPLGPEDLAERAWVPNSGWPVHYGEFSRYLARAHDVCGVPQGSYRWDQLRAAAGLGPLPLDSARYEGVVFRYSRPARRFGQAYREDVRTAPNMSCILHATALRLVTDDSGARVTHVEVGSLAGKRTRVAASRFVIACGGIENSRLLLLSTGGHPRGLGNEHDQVGRYFMEHPRFQIGRARLAKTPGAALLGNSGREIGGLPIRVDFRLCPDVQAREKILNHSVMMEPMSVQTPNGGYKFNVATLRRLWKETMRSLAPDPSAAEEGSFPHNGVDYRLRVRLECAPRPESRITLSTATDAFQQPRARVHLALGNLESRTLEKVQRLLALELGRTGLGRLQIVSPQHVDDWPGLEWQYHHMGGTRMSNSPSNGVVDRDCRVHGTKNLYVAGSSVFPTSGHAHPTLNLVALTLRLADKLRSEAGK
jgi:choline dehydrogenase-like flavoprotein